MTNDMKKTALIGASGFVGSAILNELLSRGYNVEALVRNPENVKVKDPHLTVKKVDVADTKALAADLRGYETVISAYNPGWTNPDIYNLTLQNYPRILEAAKEAGVKRLLIVGGAGTLFCAPGLRVVDSGVIPDEIMGGVKSLGEFYLETLNKENAIDWVFFSPAGSLEPGGATGTYRLGKDDLIVDSEGNSRITVGDYAKAMVDELEAPAHHQERFTIGY
jgi:NAD-dependent epimerase/dehydratase